jgi:hypothetical protein
MPVAARGGRAAIAVVEPGVKLAQAIDLNEVFMNA